jgi:hypothetical protein
MLVFPVAFYQTPRRVWALPRYRRSSVSVVARANLNDGSKCKGKKRADSYQVSRCFDIREDLPTSISIPCPCSRQDAGSLGRADLFWKSHFIHGQCAVDGAL